MTGRYDDELYDRFVIPIAEQGWHCHSNICMHDHKACAASL